MSSDSAACNTCGEGAGGGDGGKSGKRGPGARAGRRDYSHLPRVEVVWDFPGGGYCCPECATPFHRRMIQTAWQLGDLAQYEHLNLRRWAHYAAPGTMRNRDLGDVMSPAERGVSC